MRNFRNAAVSGLTALAILAGGTTAAFADDTMKAPAPLCSKVGYKEGLGNQDCETNDIFDDLSNPNNASNSSVWGDRYQADRDVVGTDLLGWHKNFDRQPIWSQIWYAVTVLGVIGSVVGLVSVPVINEAKNLGVLR